MLSFSGAVSLGTCGHGTGPAGGGPALLVPRVLALGDGRALPNRWDWPEP